MRDIIFMLLKLGMDKEPKVRIWFIQTKSTNHKLAVNRIEDLFKI